MDWNAILEDFREELMKNSILEEVDESFVDSLSFDGRSHMLNTFLGIGVLAGSSATIYALYKGSRWSYAFTFVPLGTLSFLTIHLMIRRRIRAFISHMIECRSSARAALNRIHKRELVATSLDLTSHSRLRCRYSCLYSFRTINRAMSSWSTQLINAIQLQTENDHQLALFYSQDMKSLLSEDNDGHCSDRGLLTLLDLLNLHRSELARIMMLSMSSSNSLKEQLFILSMMGKINTELQQSILDLNGICILRTEFRKIQKISQPQINISKPADGIYNIATALADLSVSICEDNISVDEVDRVLGRIVGMLSMYRQVHGDKVQVEPGKPEPTVPQEKPHLLEVSRLIERPIDSDQMFETVTDSVLTQCDTDYDDEYVWSMAKRDGSLMSELRMALGEKSEEFSKRERKALAEFYGISEEEMKNRQEEEKKTETEQLPEEKEHSTVGEGGDGASEWVRPAPIFTPLSSELLNALRSRRQGSEELIGDSDEDTD